MSVFLVQIRIFIRVRDQNVDHAKESANRILNSFATEFAANTMMNTRRQPNSSKTPECPVARRIGQVPCTSQCSVRVSLSSVLQEQPSVPDVPTREQGPAGRLLSAQKGRQAAQQLQRNHIPVAQTGHGGHVGPG